MGRSGLFDLQQLVVNIPHGPRVALARRFAERKLYDEAAELFGVALRVEPRNLGTRLALARVRRLQKAQGRAAASKDPIENARSEMRRNGIDASHFVGLAWLYAASTVGGILMALLPVVLSMLASRGGGGRRGCETGGRR